MKLTKLSLSEYASIKSKLNFHIDGRITTLIGANDTGKTNLLKAIRCLNEDIAFTTNDVNWDAPKDAIPKIEWTFSLTLEDRTRLATAAKAVLEAKGKSVTDMGDSFLVMDKTGDLASLSDDAVKTQPGQLYQLPFPTEIRIQRTADRRLVVVSDQNHEFWSSPEIDQEILTMKPRVELFAPVEQATDVITLQELEDPEQEFMQGIFRYADIWEQRGQLFHQTPATEHQLSRASTTLTERIRKEWQQGEDLSFRLSHTGQNGDHIQLYIGDPAVAERYVRPSERSEGFSAFFKMSMRLLARTEKSGASSYIFLFDEPGTALHPAGQVNLLRVFETLSNTNQIVYSTHSLFMINHNRPHRNRVISKTDAGTQVNQKPFLKNWQAVRSALGLVLAGTFFIADRTLLVEGESDAMYLGALMGAYDRAGVANIDLNLFSVQWAGNERDFSPMARLLLEEGREVVALVDGDQGGRKLKRNLEILNAEIKKTDSTLKAVSVLELSDNNSTEDLLPHTDRYFRAVIEAAQDLIKGNFREFADQDLNENKMLGQLNGERTNLTLGRHVERVTRSWFKDPDPISKLAIARNYISWLEDVNPRELRLGSIPTVLRQIAEKLRLGSKQSDKAVFERQP